MVPSLQELSMSVLVNNILNLPPLYKEMIINHSIYAIKNDIRKQIIEDEMKNITKECKKKAYEKLKKDLEYIIPEVLYHVHENKFRGTIIPQIQNIYYGIDSSIIDLALDISLSIYPTIEETIIERELNRNLNNNLNSMMVDGDSDSDNYEY